MFKKFHKIYNFKDIILALAGVAQWIECKPAKQKVAGLIPSQGHMSGLWARSPAGTCEMEPHIDVSLPLFLPPFSSLKINKVF